MPASRCRHCDVILLDEEAAAPSCPACGAALAETPPATPLVEPLPEPRRPWVLFAALLAQALVLAWLWSGRPTPTPPTAVEDTDAYRALLSSRREAEAGLAKALADLKAATRTRPAGPVTPPQPEGPTREEWEKRLAGLNRALEQSEKERAGALARVAAAEKALEEERARADRPAPPAAAGAVPLDDPAGTHVVEAVNNGERVRLSGRIGTLRVRGVNDGELDASALRAKSIIFDQPVNGRSTVKLHAPGGSVTLAGINAEARVEIDAPGGVLSTPDINGDSRLKARVKEVHFTGAVQGGSVVGLTLTSGGVIAFKMIQGSASVTWKKEKPSDPDPKIDEGEVRGEGGFRKEG